MTDEQVQIEPLSEPDAYRVRVCEAEAQLSQAYSTLSTSLSNLALAKANVKQAEEMKESCVQALRDAIRGRGQGVLPFKEDEPIGRWEDVPLSTLGLSDAIVAHLSKAGMSTIGALADYTSDDNQFVTIKGIGPSAAQQIDDALEAYFEAHPETDHGNQE